VKNVRVQETPGWSLAALIQTVDGRFNTKVTDMLIQVGTSHTLATQTQQSNPQLASLNEPFVHR
jgi:hypothetical protein